mmetsp:Transcript_602/g.1226  ORF Transcript_602/g.1226 Transcript_602/m.1226 type:complete len:97 (-) Transcript_602:309-599(-)
MSHHIEDLLRRIGKRHGCQLTVYFSGRTILDKRNGMSQLALCQRFGLQDSLTVEDIHRGGTPSRNLDSNFPPFPSLRLHAEAHSKPSSLISAWDYC